MIRVNIFREVALMPKIYLSPSTQQGNQYVTGGSEEYYMNLVADALEPYLTANAISFTRNRPDMKVTEIQRESNAGDYALHLALHSNASPEGRYGTLRGVDIYYFGGSPAGKRAADITADNFKVIYPDPNLVTTRTTTSLGEVDRVKAPSLFIEIAYHDNVDDANWITNNIDRIARTIALSLAEYFGQPLFEPMQPQKAVVSTSGSNLNLRSRPNEMSAVIGRIPNGAQVTVNGVIPEWASVEYNGRLGFVSRRYLNMR